MGRASANAAVKLLTKSKMTFTFNRAIIDNFSLVEQHLLNKGYEELAETIVPAARNALLNIRHGDFAKWLEIINRLPVLEPGDTDFNSGAVKVSNKAYLKAPEIQAKLKALLRGLMPWRKGPYDIHGIFIDTEWRSDLKWDRLKNHVSSLEGKTLLDVGCGNGYHCWRMYGAGAEIVIGIDPSPLFLCQFNAVKHFAGMNHPVFLLPMKLEEFPNVKNGFDTVFSMGLLYHRRNPIGHLERLRDLLKPGGELVLETIILNREGADVLVPEGRYAKMNNVWFIPSPRLLKTWLKRTGFRAINLVDITPTTEKEQRRTEWMDYESLSDFLDPEKPSLTVEGYPAPERAIFVMKKYE